MNENHSPGKWRLLVMPWLIAIPTAILGLNGEPAKTIRKLPAPFNGLAQYVHVELAVPGILILTWICGSRWYYRRHVEAGRTRQDALLASIMFGFAFTAAQVCLALAVAFVGCLAMFNSSR